MYNRFLIKDYNKGKYSTLEITSFYYITLNLYNSPFKVQYGNLRKKYGMLTYNFRNYKGKEYLSKAQCMALEGITRKELEEYLKGDKPISLNVDMDGLKN